MKFKHEFVDYMPDMFEEGVIYISLEYGCVIHLCACGCGEEVNTPLSPTAWRMTYNGKNITLYPSIGNWGFHCRSHYWIRNGEVMWAEDWSDYQIELNRKLEQNRTSEYFETNRVEDQSSGYYSEKSELTPGMKDEQPFWDKIKRWLNF